jgi:diguanylate cyclase (GGDEF)-like protein/PAS domain S-box-containing protein
MPVSRPIGLLLRREEERAIFRQAALDSGLATVDLSPRTHGTPTVTYPRPTGSAPLLLLVTDEITEAMPHLYDDFHLITQADSPLMLLVRDALPKYAGNPDPDDYAFAWVVYRPLRIEEVRDQLREAARAARVIVERTSSILQRFQHSRQIFDSVCNGITIADARKPDLPLVYVNPAFERMTGYSAHEICGRNCRFLQADDASQPELMKVREAIRDGTDVRVQIRNYRKDGTPFWNELYLSPILDCEGRLTHFLGIQNDVTAQVESARRLLFLSHHDALTGLANRTLLIETLNHSLTRARRSGGRVAVLFFDLDRFKDVNDVFGHDAGDRLLQAVADRLRAGVRSSETVARLGGDEFIVALEDLSPEREPAAIMQRLSASVGDPFDVLGHCLRVSASVGMALFPRDGETPEALLKAADFNMYVAKHAGSSVDVSVHADAVTRR